MRPPSAPRDRFAPPRAAGVAVLAALLACADSPLPERHAPATARRIAPVPWDTVWRRGGAVEDTLLLMPIAVAADSARAYVLDAAGHRVVAFDAATGAPAWLTAGEGGGPGEFASPGAIAAARGGAAVAGPGSARVTLLLMPIAVAADSARAYVLDAAGHRVVAFDAATGAPAWLTAGKGGGPGEFASPVAIAAARGGVVVADPGNARITFLDAAGLVT